MDIDKSFLEKELINGPEIDWSILLSAINHYKNKDYEEIKTPWIIPCEYSSLTKPHNDESFVLKNNLFSNQPHELVGSAEQGFIYLLLNNKLEKEKYYYSVTPCFRSDNYDKTHSPYFMKLELFCWSIQSEKYKKIINDAANFFINYGLVELIDLPDFTQDIYLNGIEVGSYGIRKINNDYEYIYGTGVALPRLSIVKNK